ncbi:uncharacterized protein TNCV_21931 [Trichonephila clavipes]|nr:uncharacterized protein TNCV_21931 [Trichonephila clavipes]
MVEKLIMSKHLQLEHAGTQTLMSCLRESFWIIKSRKTVRGVIKRCTKCRRFSARPLEAVSVPLPEDRARKAAVFEVTGIDLLHLELVSSLSTECFILALCEKEDIARRGRPTTIYSDNGKNLVGTTNLLQKIDWKKIENFATEKGFPGNSVLLLHPEDPDELSALTPFMFLQEIREVGVPDLDMIDSKRLNKRCAYKLKLRQDLRNRFRNEYLGIQKDYSRVKGESSIKEGDLVLIGDANNKRVNWPLGKVTKMYKGKDGKVHVMEVKTQFGSVMRPIQKLYLLEVTTVDSLPLTERDIEDGPCLDQDQIPGVQRVCRSRYGRLLQQTRDLTIDKLY